MTLRPIFILSLAALALFSVAGECLSSYCSTDDHSYCVRMVTIIHTEWWILFLATFAFFCMY